MKQKDRFEFVLNHFRAQMPIAETELAYTNSYQLLVAVILSAQCTDKRVNMVTPSLFSKFPDVKALANADIEDIFRTIKSISYPNNKAKHLSMMAKMIIEKFNGMVPETRDELMLLPGVGRKTANVIISVVFNQSAMAVDTHVFRVSNRIGLTLNSKNPLNTESQLLKFIPEHEVPIAHHWLILHGRYVCTARKPKCSICNLSEVCKYHKKNQIIKKNFTSPNSHTL